MLESRIDATGARATIAIRRGQDFVLPLEVDASLVGASLLARIYTAAGATVASFAVTITNAAAGLAELRLTAAQTRALSDVTEGEDTSLRWGVTFVDSLGARTPLVSGPVAVSGELAP